MKQMEKLLVLIMIMPKSHKWAPSHELVAFIKLKQAIHKFVLLRRFCEFHLEHLQEQTSQNKVREVWDKNTKMFLR